MPMHRGCPHQIKYFNPNTSYKKRFYSGRSHYTMATRLTTNFCEFIPITPEHASLFLTKYGNLLSWTGKKEIIADIGCANGQLTTDILLPFCGDKVEKIIGIDISPEMLVLANERNKKSNVSFLEMDVAKKDLDSNMIGKFDHVFSFYCVHMINNQRQFAENVYKMLKPGGEIFLTCHYKNDHIESAFMLSKSKKWSTYLENFPNTYSPYFTSAQPQEDLERVFKDVGFSIESHKSGPLEWEMDRDEFETMVKEVSLVIDYIPQRLREEFLNDSVELTTKLCKRGDSFVVKNNVIVAVAKKPVS